MDLYERQRHLIDDQNVLFEAKALVIGAGGLGSSVLYHLVSAGIGRIGIVECDTLQLSNLNRQILYSQGDIGGRKAALAKQRLEAYHKDIHIETYDEKLTPTLAQKIFSKYDIIIDCVDNYKTRKITNEAAVSYGLPLVEGGIEKQAGFVQIVIPGSTACFNCFDVVDKPITPQVLGASVSIIGSIQALEAIKLLIGKYDKSYSYLSVDLDSYEISKLFLAPRDDCICHISN